MERAEHQAAQHPLTSIPGPLPPGLDYDTAPGMLEGRPRAKVRTVVMQVAQPCHEYPKCHTITWASVVMSLDGTITSILGQRLNRKTKSSSHRHGIVSEEFKPGAWRAIRDRLYHRPAPTDAGGGRRQKRTDAQTIILRDMYRQPHTTTSHRKPRY